MLLSVHPTGGTPLEVGRGKSVPDAWILDPDPVRHEYCLLIECKRGGNEPDEQQVLNHARKHFAMNEKEAKLHMVSLTWYDVLRSIEKALAQEPRPNRQEEHVLRSLDEFLGILDYRLFKGFGFVMLERLPAWQLHGPVRRALFHFDELGAVPAFGLWNKKGDRLGQ